MGIYNLPPATWRLVDKIALGTLSAFGDGAKLSASFSDTESQLTLMPGGNVRYEKQTVEYLYGYVQQGGCK